MLTRILAATAASLSLLGLASAAQAAQSASPSPPFQQVNLHAAYERALPHAIAAKKGGTVYAYHKRTSAAFSNRSAAASGKRPGAATGHTSSSCAEPNCPLQYNGGLVQHAPRVYLLLWGPNWSDPSHPGQEAAATYLASFYSGLGANADAWSAINSQYSDSSGNPTFSGSVFAGVFNDATTPPKGVDQTQLAAEADAFASKHGLANQTTSIDDQIVIATQSGTCPYDFYAPHCNGGNGYYCAWHSYSPRTGVTYTNLPYLPDSGVGYLSGCGSGWVNSPYDGFTIVGGHEYAETVTDPQPPYSWVDNNDDVSGGEIGDKCGWVDPTTGNIDISTVALSTGTFAMQPLFSNNALSGNTGHDGCVLSANATNEVNVNAPGFVLSALGKWASAQVRATDSASGQTFTYSALGLPPGLSINSATGRITGTPTKAGEYLPTVIATDTTQSTSSANFPWLVVTGHPMKGYKGRCAAVATAGGYPTPNVVLRKCNGAPTELWRAGGRKSLRAAGMCLTAPWSGRAGAKVLMIPCMGSKAQRWTHKSNGEYVVTVKHKKLCLTDPGKSTKNGARLTAAVCRNTANQRWTRP